MQVNVLLPPWSLGHFKFIFHLRIDIKPAHNHVISSGFITSLLRTDDCSKIIVEK